jgi:dimethylhistidine N-methyltransferase
VTHRRVDDVNDFAPSTESMLEEVLSGLRRPNKSIPSKLLYDARGSELFEEICELDEYYLTRTELAIMEEHAPEMAERLGPECLLIEYGSGSGLKTEYLLDHLEEPCGYVPIDISRHALEQSVVRMQERFPGLETAPVHADYTGDYEIPDTRRPASRRVVYFPGSTIGNLKPDHAEGFLKHVREVCGADGGLLVGVDLEKDPKILELAYDDPPGVTAAFELNVLQRLNRELGCDFQLDRFMYEACYNPAHARVEMYLVSEEEQTVTVGETEIPFEAGERILTEYSYKYTPERFAELATKADLDLEQVWTDSENLFGVNYLIGR